VTASTARLNFPKGSRPFEIENTSTIRRYGELKYQISKWDIMGNGMMLKKSKPLQELRYNAMSIKQMRARSPSPEGAITSMTLPLLLVTMTRSQKSQTIFNHSSNIMKSNLTGPRKA
jgi:hypothetical protein